MSTPFSVNCLRLEMYGGRWKAWQPGVKAPVRFVSGCDLGEKFSVRRRTWYGEEDDLLVGPFFARIVLLRATAGSWVLIGDGCPSVKVSLAISLN